jgi:hypothetical protein
VLISDEPINGLDLDGIRWIRGVEQVLALDVVELQCFGDGFRGAVGGCSEVASLEPVVAVDAQSGDGGRLLAPQPGYASAALGHGPACLLRRDPRAPGHQELLDLPSLVHGETVGQHPRGREDLPVPVSTGPVTAKKLLVRWPP